MESFTRLFISLSVLNRKTLLTIANMLDTNNLEYCVKVTNTITFYYFRLFSTVDSVLYEDM